jgi:hypothetical protein
MRLTRLISLILSSGIALTSIPACASAASNTLRPTSVSTCPIYEGYPDCHPEGRSPWTAYSSSWRV